MFLLHSSGCPKINYNALFSKIFVTVFNVPLWASLTFFRVRGLAPGFTYAKEHEGRAMHKNINNEKKKRKRVR